MPRVHTNDLTVLNLLKSNAVIVLINQHAKKFTKESDSYIPVNYQASNDIGKQLRIRLQSFSFISDAHAVDFVFLRSEQQKYLLLLCGKLNVCVPRFDNCSTEPAVAVSLPHLHLIFQ